MYTFRYESAGERMEASVHEGLLQTSREQSVEIGVQAEEFLRVLSLEPDTPFLATEIKAASDILTANQADISNLYKQTHLLLGKVGLADALLHVGKVGAGRSKQYGMRTSDDVEVLLDFAHRGLFKIGQKKLKKIQRHRQEIPFRLLIASIEDTTTLERAAHRKSLAIGAVVVALSVGTAATIFLARHHTKE